MATPNSSIISPLTTINGSGISHSPKGSTTSVLSDDIGGILSHILEACTSLCPQMVVGECWTSSTVVLSPSTPSSSSSAPSNSSNEWNQLVSFYAPTPLIANHTENDGKPVTRHIDIRIASAFSSIHTVSLRIIDKIMKNNRIDWFYDLEGDQLVSLLKFPLQSVIGVPIMINQDHLVSRSSSSSSRNNNNYNGRSVCCAIILLYSAKYEEQNGSVLSGLQNIAKLASRIIQIRLMEQQQHNNNNSSNSTNVAARSRISYRYQVPPPPPSLITDSTLTPEEIARNADTGEDEAIYQPWLTGTIGLLKAAASVLSADYVEICVKLENAGTAKTNENNSDASREFISLFPHAVPPWKPRIGSATHSHTTGTSSLSHASRGSAGTVVSNDEKPVPPKDASISLAIPRTDHNGSLKGTKDSNGSPLYGAIDGAFLSAAIREASLFTRNMCNDATVAASNQPITWLFPHEMVARSNNHWQAASVMNLTLPVGQAIENDDQTTLSLDFTPNARKSVQRRTMNVHVVALFFWTEVGYMFGSPDASSFLTNIAASARTCASLSSIPSDANGTEIFKASNRNSANRLSAPPAGLHRELSGDNERGHSNGPLSPNSTGSGGYDGGIINSLVSFSTTAIDRTDSELNLQGQQNSTTTVAPNKNSSASQIERVLSTTNNALMGNAMRRPRSGLDLLAAYSTGDTTALVPPEAKVDTILEKPEDNNTEIGINLHAGTDASVTVTGKRVGGENDKMNRPSLVATTNTTTIQVDTTVSSSVNGGGNGPDSAKNTGATNNLASATTDKTDEDIKRARLPSVAASESGVEGAHDMIAMVNSINPNEHLTTPRMHPMAGYAETYQNPYLYNPQQHVYDNNGYLNPHGYMNHPAAMYGGGFNPYVAHMMMGTHPQPNMMMNPNVPMYPDYPMLDHNGNPMMNPMTMAMMNPTMPMPTNHHHPDGLGGSTIGMGPMEHSRDTLPGNGMRMDQPGGGNEGSMREDNTAKNEDGTGDDAKPKKKRGGARVKSSTNVNNTVTATNMDLSPVTTPSTASVNNATTNSTTTAVTTGTGPGTATNQEVSFVGLPVVPASALARVKGRSRAPKPKLSVALRRGKWPVEEEDFTSAIVETFREGYLPLADGTTLRTYLSGQLHCAPMRITKKFAKDASIGKQVYKRRNDMDKAEWDRRSNEARTRVLGARSRFHNSVMLRNRIDLRLIVPDPFPEGGIVKSVYGLDDDDEYDDDYDEGDDDENVETNDDNGEAKGDGTELTSASYERNGSRSNKRTASLSSASKRSMSRTNSGRRNKMARNDTENSFGFSDDQFNTNDNGNFIDGMSSSSSFMMGGESNRMPTSFTEMLDGPTASSSTTTLSGMNKGKKNNNRKSQSSNDLRIKSDQDYDPNGMNTPLMDNNNNNIIVMENGSTVFASHRSLNNGGMPHPMMNPNNIYHQGSFDNMQGYGSMVNMMMNNNHNGPHNNGFLPNYYMGDTMYNMGGTMGNLPPPNTNSFMITNSENNTPLPKYDDHQQNQIMHPDIYNSNLGIHGNTTLSSLPSASNFQAPTTEDKAVPVATSSISSHPLQKSTPLRNSMEDLVHGSTSVASFTDEQLTSYNNNPGKRNRNNNNSKAMNSNGDHPEQNNDDVNKKHETDNPGSSGGTPVAGSTTPSGRKGKY